ncbi:MAG: hypothetical protein WBP81_28870 [Solirubrobacteraceae bacterium]
MTALADNLAQANGAAAVLREADIEGVLGQLDRELVALAPVKIRIREIAALLVVDQLRRRAGLSAGRPTLHMSFTGYGVEAIEILLQVMEKERERLVVILAGYKDRMDDFFRLNPGMSSRVAQHIERLHDRRAGLRWQLWGDAANIASINRYKEIS